MARCVPQSLSSSSKLAVALPGLHLRRRPSKPKTVVPGIIMASADWDELVAAINRTTIDNVNAEAGVAEANTTAQQVEATNNTPERLSLLGLPVELRLKIYGYLTAAEHELDLDQFRIARLPSSPLPRAPNAESNFPRSLQIQRPFCKSYSWIFTCRTMFDEGQDEILKTHIIVFESEKEFSDSYVTGQLKNVRFICVDGFPVEVPALRYAKNREEFLKNLKGAYVWKRWRLGGRVCEYDTIA